MASDDDVVCEKPYFSETAVACESEYPWDHHKQPIECFYIFCQKDEVMAAGDLDGSYLGTPTVGAINDTAKVKRSQPFTTQGKLPNEQEEVQHIYHTVAQVSSLDDLRRVSALEPAF